MPRALLAPAQRRLYADELLRVLVQRPLHAPASALDVAERCGLDAAVGTMGLAVAVLVQLQSARTRHADRLSALAAALVLATASFSVVEYETDFPQFPAVWYLPVLATAAALALSLVQDAWPRRRRHRGGGGAPLAFVLGVSGFLAAEGFQVPALPLLVVPALALDVTARRGWSAPARAAAFVVALFVVYLSVRSLLGAGLEVSPREIAAGFLLALVVVTVVFAACGGLRLGRPRSALVAALVLGAVLLAAAPALAHDPGQGEDAGTVAWTATTRGRTTSVAVRLPGPCPAARSGELVVRRAGRVIRAPLAVAGCAATGRVRVDADGRWFVYADLRRRGRRIESWMPVGVGGSSTVVRDGHRFAYVPDRQAGGAVKVVVGTGLYRLVAAALIAMIALVSASATAAPGSLRPSA